MKILGRLVWGHIPNDGKFVSMQRRHFGTDQKATVAAVGSWKRELQRWADADELEIIVGHDRTGASKWNPVEHLAFLAPSASTGQTNRRVAWE